LASIYRRQGPGGYAGTSRTAPCPDFFAQNPTPLNDWSRITSPSADVAWAISFSGQILKTVDGGRTWKDQWSPVQYWRNTPPLYDISAPSDKVAWICAENGIVVMTTDGGENWSQRNVGQQVDLKGISALNGSVAWAVGEHGNVFVTANGGQSWSNSDIGIDVELDGVWALSATNAWVSGGGSTVAVTTNGGLNWNILDLSAYPTANLVSIKAFSNQRVYAIGNNHFFSTTDGGANWNVKDFGSTIKLMSLSFIDTQNGWISGTDEYKSGFMTKTGNGGQNWTRQNPPQLADERNMTGISAPTRSSVYAVSEDGALIHSGNGGESWTRTGTVLTRSIFTGVSAIDKKSAWAAGENGTIVRTFNGGRAWVTQTTNVKNDLGDIDAVDSSTAWAVGENGAVIKTTNYGTTWLKQDTGTSADLVSVSAVSKNEAWACGNQGTQAYVFHTIDGGQSWQIAFHASGARASSVAAWDSQNAWFGLADIPKSFIYRTNDGGKTWGKATVPRPVSIQAITDIRGLKPVSKDVCLTIIETSAFVDTFIYMYKTTDGGKSWGKAGPIIFADGDLFRLATLDGNSVWSCGASLNPYAEPTVVYRTKNGGSSWGNGKIFHRTVMFGIDMADDGTMWTVGYMGTIFRSTVPSIFSISPNSADNIGTVRIADIAGSGFSDGMEVWLENGDAKIKGTNVVVKSPYEATCEFNLDSAPVGAYDVITKNINGMQDKLTEAFNVTTPTEWYLPEGSTGISPQGNFETYILIQNPTDRQAVVEVIYTTPSGWANGISTIMAPKSRQTVNVGDTVPNQWSVSTRIFATQPVIVERSMYWNGSAYRQSATGSLGLTHMSKHWYLPEGSTGIGNGGAFETWVLVQNAGAEPANVHITYMTPQGRRDGPTLSLEPSTRQTVNVADTVPNEWSVSTSVESDQPIAAEKAVYWNGAENRQAATDSIGASGPSRQWYLAEGSTASDSRGNLETWVLLENPFDQTAHAQLYYQLPDRQVAGPEVVLEPYTRKTVNVGDTVPNEYSVSTKVVADGPVVAERSMYWNSGTPKITATGSIGVTAPHTEWLIAEGSTGRDARGSFETWILVQNPGVKATNVKLTYYTPEGPVEGPAFDLAAGTRRSVSVADTVKENWSVSTRVESDNPVVAERAVYWSDISQFWRSGQTSCSYAPY
jgi:photosystem II stability/assembly factor-like uncharacterized protein